MQNTNSGIYQINIEVVQESVISIGQLGSFIFPKGKYVYTGRAKKYLLQRIKRHHKTNKKCFWHIDYLLIHKHVKIINITLKSNDFNKECSENKKLINCKTKIIANKFGSTDCKHKCNSHLLYLNSWYDKSFLFSLIIQICLKIKLWIYKRTF